MKRQQTGRRPRRWTPGGTPARRDFNRQPFSETPARRDVNRQPFSAQGSVHEGGRDSVREGGRPAERPHGAISIASSSAARPRGAISIASPSPGGTPARRDFNRQPLSSHTRQPPLATADGAASADGTAQLSRDWSYAHQSYTNVSDVWL